ncbi:MAG: hypothetical protein HY537_06365 [Deltaproteobacteria bacterium]|nr:hypothetical protein [Deltaproteobacteria bacterium]
MQSAFQKIMCASLLIVAAVDLVSCARIQDDEPKKPNPNPAGVNLPTPQLRKFILDGPSELGAGVCGAFEIRLVDGAGQSVASSSDLVLRISGLKHAAVFEDEECESQITVPVLESESDSVVFYLKDDSAETLSPAVSATDGRYILSSDRFSLKILSKAILSFATPSTADFGKVLLNLTGRLEFSFSNSGETPAVLQVGFLPADQTEFATSGADCGEVLFPGQNCKVVVTFSPANKELAQAQLRIAYNNMGNSSQPLDQEITLNLSGMGVAGGPDTSFDPDGTIIARFRQNFAISVVKAVIVSNNKIYVAGYGFNDSTQRFEFVLARLGQSGTPTGWTVERVATKAFGLGHAYANDLAIDPVNNKIILVGFAYDGLKHSVAVARYNDDENLSEDTPFVLDPAFTMSAYDEARTVSIQSGKIIVAGSTKPGSNTVFFVARLTGSEDASVTPAIPAGTLDKTFGEVNSCTTDPTPCAAGTRTGMLRIALGSGNNDANASAVQLDGKIVVAGSANGVFGVARLNAMDGSLDQYFGSAGLAKVNMGGTASANAIAIQADQKIVVAGNRCTSVTDCDVAVTRLEDNGQLDGTFSGGARTYDIGSQTHDHCYGVVVDSAGNILIAGDTGSEQAHDALVMRLLPNGTPDSSFGDKIMGAVSVPFQANAAADDHAFTVSVSADGKIIIAGSTYDGSITQFAVGSLLP